MRRLSAGLFVWLCCMCVQAQQMHFQFMEVPLTDALSQINRFYPNDKIHFIVDDLQGYTVTANVNSTGAMQAIMQLIGIYPLKVTRDKRHFFIQSSRKQMPELCGRLIDEQQQSVPYATILLYHPTDSIFLIGGTSNEKGDFQIPVDEQEVIMYVSRLGYSPVQIHTPVTHIGVVKMSSNPIRLKETSVYAQRPTYWMEDNSLILNVEGTPLSRMKHVS